MPVNEIINVITMGHRLVTAARPVDVSGIVATASMVGGADIRILIAHLDHVFDDRTVFANVMQVTIVQIVDVVPMPHTGVLAVGSVLMIVILVNVAHRLAPISGGMFDRVHDAVGHQARNVLIREGVEDMLAFAP